MYIKLGGKAVYRTTPISVGPWPHTRCWAAVRQCHLVFGLFRPPGTLVPGGLMFYCWCFFLLYFFRRATSELPRPIAVKLCHMITIWVHFIVQVQKFGGPSPREIGGQKHAKFQTTSDFDREYLRKGSRYPKSEKQVITSEQIVKCWITLDCFYQLFKFYFRIVVLL